ncbi:hypothetical protein TWF718_006788 [Orbilia javanica]|uniref:Uncharacterized protein n=1 Tax=Orbilia javanica TaxID=47235 RepID=A0AAN8N5W0_9PEZI
MSGEFEGMGPWVACMLCGARVFAAPPGVPVGPNSAWMGRPWFLTFGVKPPPLFGSGSREDDSLQEYPPTITGGRTCIVNAPVGSLDVEPEVYDDAVGGYVRTGVMICPVPKRREEEVYDGKCYVFHGQCWGSFDGIARGMGCLRGGGYDMTMFPNVVKKGTYDVGFLRVLVGILEGGEVVGGGREGEYRLRFAHGFGDEELIEGYWDVLGRYGVGDLDAGLKGLVGRYALPEEKPVADFLGVYTDLRADSGGRRMDSVGWLKAELEEAGMEDAALALRGGGFWVPVIEGLPVEVLMRVLEFLGGDGIIRFGIGGWRGERRVRVPEGIWKREFGVRGGLGWARHAVSGKGREGLTWFERFLNARAIIRFDGELGCIANWRRVFGVWEGILDVISDVEGAKVEGVEEEGSGVPRRGFKVVVPRGRGGEGRYLGLGGFRTTGVMVSYTGSGRMRFVSGMRFLPGGEAVGIVNLGDEVYCELFGKGGGDLMVLRVRFGEFGVRSVFSEVIDEVDGGGEEGGMVEETRFFAGPEGVYVGGVSVSIDAYKITAFGIDCEAFGG